MDECRWISHSEDGWSCTCRRPNGYVSLEMDWHAECRDVRVIVQECGADVDEIYPEWPGLDWWPTEEEAKAAARRLADEYLGATSGCQNGTA